MEGMVKGSGGSPRRFPVSYLVLPAGLASVHLPKRGLWVLTGAACENNLRKDLVWEVEVGCVDHGLGMDVARGPCLCVLGRCVCTELVLLGQTG